MATECWDALHAASSAAWQEPHFAEPTKLESGDAPVRLRSAGVRHPRENATPSTARAIRSVDRRQIPGRGGTTGLAEARDRPRRECSDPWPMVPGLSWSVVASGSARRVSILTTSGDHYARDSFRDRSEEHT